MNKAFVKEETFEPEPLIVRDPLADIPAGCRNYMTPRGARRLQEELDRLVRRERPRLLARIHSGDRDGHPPLAPSERNEARRELQRIERRIEFLAGRLAVTEVIDPAAQRGERILFGATVTVADGEGEERVYRIVGIDEADIERGAISWTSPIGRALLGHRQDDQVRIRTPAGAERLEIVEIAYRSHPGLE